MPPVLSTETIAHLGTAGDSCPAAFQSRFISQLGRVQPRAERPKASECFFRSPPKPTSRRMRGSRNALSEEVICAILRDFRQYGQKAVAKVRQTQPAAYLKICAL